MTEPIVKLLSQFANSLDLKDWQTLENTMADNIECDYQDLRGKSETYSKSKFVSLRKQALNHLKTQHLFTNLEMTIEKEYAVCQLNAIIYRQDNDGKQFNSHAIYRFHFVKLQNDEWKIEKIKQSILWNDGDSSIHAGVAY